MGNVSFITGGTRGIGLALAYRLLAQGHCVTVTGTTPSGAERAQRQLESACGDPARVQAMACDVRDRAQVGRAVQATVDRWGGLDVVVNNAGVGVGQPISELSHDEWDRIIDTNLTGVFNVCRAAIPHLVTRGAGWIINVSSLASQNPFVGGAAYCASKAGLNAFSDALMFELRHQNIRVSTVLPGSVATDFMGPAVPSDSDWKLSPDDVAQAIDDLLRHPLRSLPGHVELRPTHPPRKK